MKLATYKDGSRDGQLVVVSRDLSQAHYASGIANHLQQVLDDWNFLAPQLQDLSVTLNQGKARHAFPFDPAMCMAPLPRAHHWASRLARAQPAETGPLGKASNGAQTPQNADGPLMQQGDSGDLLGPCDPIACSSEDLGIDWEAGLAVLTGELPMGCDPQRALDGVRLLLLVNAVALRQLEPAEWARGAGLLHSRPATAFGPVAVTPDELGAAWADGRLGLRVQTAHNGRRLGLCEATQGMPFHFGQLLAQLCKTRRLRPGSLVGSGALSHPNGALDGQKNGANGLACIADQRDAERQASGQASSAYLQFGDAVQVQALGRDGQSVFGAIEQRVCEAD